MFMVYFELASKHTVHLNLMSKGRVYASGIFFTLVEVIVFVAKVCGNAAYLDIELLDFLMGMQNFKAAVHRITSCRRCPWVTLNLIASIT